MLNSHSFFAWRNVKSRKKRSFLTVLGIVIGIIAIVTLSILGNSLDSALTDRFDKFGTRRIFIGPKKINTIAGPPTGISKLTNDDVETIKSLPYTEYVMATYMDNANVEFGKEEEYVLVAAFEAKNIEKSFGDVNIKLEGGKWINENDKYGALIGYGIAHKLFDREIKIKNSIKIEKTKFKVVGIKAEQGSQQDDYSINIPLDTYREIKNNPDAISGITTMIKPGTDIEFAAESIKKKLEKKRGDENFQVTNPSKIKKQTSEVLGIMKWVLIGIALISLVVGGIGITNSMYTSVMERTREIGVMKAIGAENHDVVMIFLIESGFLGLVGGVIGTVLGMALAYSTIGMINLSGWVTIPIHFKISVIFIGIIFSFVIGIISGTFPAIRAARLKPVDALRYE